MPFSKITAFKSFTSQGLLDLEISHCLIFLTRLGLSFRSILFGLILSLFLTVGGQAQKATLGIQTDAPGKQISPDLFGIFFEDLNYAADGGLYAELIQNRSFEYQATEQPTWNSLSFWELAKRGGGEGRWFIEAVRPVHPNNPHYVVLEVNKPGDGIGLVNPGFDGIAVKAGEKYDFSVFARQLFMNGRWSGANAAIDGKPMPIIVRLESKDGEVLSEAPIQVVGRNWSRLTAQLSPSRNEDNARLVILVKAAGGIALDEISLFPNKTFRDRSNGLRNDLAQTIADLKPKFIRFPGGCLAHGNGINNFYRWKDTIGPIEQRRGQSNLWGYHQSVGLGYFEYFQFAEDIGAKPLPVVPAGVSCQNSDHVGGIGQQCLDIKDMPAFIQDIFDLIEWANGPATSKWGAKRAQAGHPKTFNLKYLGVGNEDAITPEFNHRFKMIFEAVKAKHPEITVVGTVGPFPDGEDFEKGWKIADQLRIPMVDEHYYKPPNWFLENLNRYDSYDRSRSKVYLGEYAAHDEGRKTTLRSALAEAAYMIGLERNGDVVSLASYAPLLAKVGHTQWNPNLIYFSNTRITPTINYHVQQMFGSNQGEVYLTNTLTGLSSADSIAVSSVRDNSSGDIIIKIVNVGAGPQSLEIQLTGTKKVNPKAQKTLLTGTPLAVNSFDGSVSIIPVISEIPVDKQFVYEAPANSLTIFRIRTR